MAIKFGLNPATRQVGQPVNMEEWNARSISAGGTVGFGVPVVQGVGDQVGIAATAAGQAILGITFAEQLLPHQGDEYRLYDTMTVAEQCVVGVQIGAAAVTTGNSQARYDVTNKVWTAATASATVLTIPGATFDEVIPANGVGAVRYRRPNPSLTAAT